MIKREWNEGQLNNVLIETIHTYFLLYEQLNETKYTTYDIWRATFCELKFILRFWIELCLINFELFAKKSQWRPLK